ncbi:MAG: hypothetical protein PHI27_11820 [Eubacteriales bacterium]|nr:hypothetical protein [Eubacteriales bacterium]MDD3882917.1 hypothetical protein [Eubacteriales bacterium]MDD4513907.1 hypothetical protein [Eubacteriales bacterium]
MRATSRAAAITNLTAADLTDSGLFTDVFAYAFATPRTTKAPKAYPNIFNIIGKFDPVPMIPAAEWGFGRNGVMLYTPAEETDSDYYLKKAAADVVSRKLTGIAFFNNTEMNNTLRTILDYLMTIIPDTATYEEHMQDIMISIWKDKGLSNLSSKLIGMMENENLLNETTKEEMEQLLDYLSLITYSTVSQRLFGGSGSWNSQTTVLDNLAHEHSPDVYVSWLFSADNADKLYSAADTYVRIAWSGAATTNVFDKEGRFVLSIDKDGRVSHSTGEPLWAASAQPIEQRPLLPCVHKNEATLLTLPRDGTYLLYLRAEKDDSLYYIGSEYNINSVRSPVNKATIVDMEKGEDYVIMSLTDEYAEDGEHLLGSSTEDIALTDEGMPYSPSFMTILENSGVFHLTFGQMAMLVGAVLMLLIIIITCLIVHFVRRHKRKKRQKAKLSQGAGESDAGIEIKS